MFNLYKTYNKAKDVFVKPKLRLEFGRWYNTTGLPVWRRGPILDLYRLLGIDIVSIDTSESTWFASKYKWTEAFKKRDYDNSRTREDYRLQVFRQCPSGSQEHR